MEAISIPWGFVSTSRFCREGQKLSGFLLGSFYSCNSHESWQSGHFATAHNQSSKKKSYWNNILHSHLGKAEAMDPVGLLQQVLSIWDWKAWCIKSPGLTSVQQCSSQIHTGQNTASFALFPTGVQVAPSLLWPPRCWIFFSLQGCKWFEEEDEADERADT